ncbi:hypothetical protein MYX82_10330 [Acidobacteria bacterium AH-259-D05]|nr:hypothetical protein [Acidobacteria bacterium AH-259-D05]
MDIFEGLAEEDLLPLRRVFQKRHVHEHNQGIICNKYVREIPEDKHLLGRPAELSLEELNAAAQSLRVVLGNLADTLKDKRKQVS